MYISPIANLSMCVVLLLEMSCSVISSDIKCEWQGQQASQEEGLPFDISEAPGWLTFSDY